MLVIGLYMANDNLQIGGEKGFTESDAQKQAREQYLASANKSKTEAGKVVAEAELGLPKKNVSAEIDMTQADALIPNNTFETSSFAVRIFSFLLADVIFSK